MKGKMLKEVQFVDDEHEKFFLDNIVRCRYEEVYHHALIYCLGISETTRRNIDSIYDFATGCIKTECLCEDWQTSGSIRIVRLAFCLYCDGTLSVNDMEDVDSKLAECREYTVGQIFCREYAKYFLEAIKLRYPEYCL
ncbi:DUF6075 family protein [Blautia wexlerae]|nr:DUF6075 family protein [Blautia wexlerae]